MRRACAFQFPIFKKSNVRTKIEKLSLMSNDPVKTAVFEKQPFPPKKTSYVNEQEYWRELQEAPVSVQAL